MSSRHLVVSADERTWPEGVPLLFLGQWCQRWDRREVWRARDFVVAEPYGMLFQQKDADLVTVKIVEEFLMPHLVELLNSHHQEDHGQRYWQMLIGHWLRRYTRIVLNRLRTLEQCLDRYEISGITLVDTNDYRLATQLSASLSLDCDDEIWNQVLCGHLLEQRGSLPFPIYRIPEERNCDASITVTKRPSLIKYRLADHFAHLLAALISPMRRKDEIFIMNSYLPKAAELGLHLLLRQPPKLSCAFKLASDFRIDKQLRAQLTGKLLPRLQDGEVRSIGTLLFNALPACYLEQYTLLSAAASNVPWPSKPAVIFTSNNFDTDEVFKVWAARKVESGSRYIVGQHGNNYGTHRHQTIHTIEELTSDRFLTWGWKDGLTQHMAGFIFKTVGRSQATYKQEGDVLLVQVGMAHRVETWDVANEFENYFADQLKFVQALPPEVVGKLRIRLYRPFGGVDRGEESRWREFNPRIALDNGSSQIRRLVGNSRLVIFSYDSTGILENLSQNIPTIAYWQNGLDHVRDSALPYYRYLVEAGIFHLSPESAAEKVSQIFDDVQGWWMQQEVQRARAMFCQQYAAMSRRPLRKLKAILESEIASKP